MKNIEDYFLTEDGMGAQHVADIVHECQCGDGCQCDGDCSCHSEPEEVVGLSVGSEPKGLDVKVKYFDGAKELVIASVGDCIDVYANKDVFVPYMGYAMIPLGFAMALPEGYIGKLYPRSSTFKTWGIIQINSVGVIDNSFRGDEDQWHMPVQCTMPKQCDKVMVNGHKVTMSGTWIKKGDKIAQFEIVPSMMAQPVKLTKVEALNEASRGGFGTTGTK